MTVTAIVDGIVIAQSDDTQVVENNQYFPPEDIDPEYHSKSASGLHTHCPWKGEASYYDLHVGDKVLRDAAWYYPSVLTDKAKSIEGYVAYYKNKVELTEETAAHPLGVPGLPACLVANTADGLPLSMMGTQQR
ncbi:hypothetical protein JCM5296_006405 [Sporobolomyces johnsonii]